MPDAPYDADILEWSEQQADLLRRAGAGERVNGLDWENVAEEIESVGRSELHACKSLLLQAVLHLMKCHGWPGSEWVGHWKSECDVFLIQARDAFSPSMARRIDLPDLYRKAASATRRERIDGQRGAPPPDPCPFLLAELLAEDADIETLVASLSEADAR